MPVRRVAPYAAVTKGLIFSRSAMLERDVGKGGAVHMSVCHKSVPCKDNMLIRSCVFTVEWPMDYSFLIPTFVPRRTSLARDANETGVGKNSEKGDFRPYGDK